MGTHPAAGVLDRTARLLEQAGRLCLYAAAGATPARDLLLRPVGLWNRFNASADEVGAGLTPWEQELADRYAPAGARVLLVGCGTGRDLIPLVERGCGATGLDPAPGAIAQARDALAARGLAARLVTGLFVDAPIEGVFDLVWFSWWTYGYIPGVARRVEALRKAAALLAPGGRIIVSAYEGEAPRSRAQAVGRAVGRLLGADWEMAPGDLITRVPGSRMWLYEHRFGPGEVEAEATTAGLEIRERRAYATTRVLALARPGESG